MRYYTIWWYTCHDELAHKRVLALNVYHALWRCRVAKSAVAWYEIETEDGIVLGDFN